MNLEEKKRKKEKNKGNIIQNWNKEERKWEKLINSAKLSIHNLKKDKISCIIERYSHSKRRVNLYF